MPIPASRAPTRAWTARINCTTWATRDRVVIDCFFTASSCRSAHPRELRVIRMSRVEDPNEEALHWAQVVELTRSYYLASDSAVASGDSTAASATTAPRNQRQSPSVNERWEKVGREAFFHLRVSQISAISTVGGQQDDQHDRVLLDVLEHLLQQQREALDSAGTERQAVRVTFSAALDYLASANQQVR